MKVENPRFANELCYCDDCPFADEHGDNESIHCLTWGDNHNSICPTRETYAEACRLAEGE